ncbi:MAG TPA: tetratricopeptide repeat protein [Candidatus Saccharimonadales bacterium]|nr:tetratricopeptide repeat protein [Candidatus Saccharimonadales bacterium]
MQHQLSYEFGPFRLDTSERILLRDGRRIPLKPKVYDTLVVLIKNSGHVLEKQELIKEVWPNTFVEENNLTGNIFALRRAFGDHQYIETIPRRGYRFTADVRQLRVEGAESIAVLPFKPLGEQSGDEILSLGMADALITRLSNLQQLIVRPSSSILKYTSADQDPLEAGRQQKVDAVLDGTIQRAAERVRVTVRLLRVQDGKQLWTDKFDEKFTDIFALQDVISDRVTAALALRLTGSEQDRLTKRYTDNAEAYQLYLKGRYFWNKRTGESLHKGVEYFTQAIAKDSHYALAHAGLADSYIILGNFGLLPPIEAYPKAKRAAEEALKADPELVEAQVSLAFVKSLFERDWPGAEVAFKRAIKLNPNYGPAHQWYGVSLAGAGRLDEAVAQVKRAQQVDPQSLTISAVLGWVLYLARDYDKAIDHEKTVLEMDSNFALAHRYLGLIYEQKGMYAEAISEFHTAESLSGARPLDSGALAHAYAIAGKITEARQILKKVIERSPRVYFPSYDIALIYVGLGEKDLAFDWLERAFEERSPWLIHLNVDPRFDSVRADPRFRDLVDRL